MSENNSEMNIILKPREGVGTKWVLMSFYQSILAQVRESIPGMIEGASYTVEELCGDDFWSDLTRAEKILAGECMVHMVMHANDLPEFELKCAPRTHALEWGLK